MSLIFIILGIFTSLLSGIFLIPYMIKTGHKYQLLDLPGNHKRHKKPTPILGGLALFVSVWISILISYLIFYESYSEIDNSLIFVFGGSLIILMVGMSDDLKPLSAWTKLLAQIAAAVLLYWGGLRYELINIPFTVIEVGNFSLLITIIWVVALTNAINLIDGLDGLASGVSFIGALFLMVLSILYQSDSSLIYILTLIGFLPVFLFYNRYPARIFLGDSGAMLIGYFFAVFSLSFSFKSFTTAALFVPLMALGVPLMEMASSFIRRLVAGKHIMKADRRHLFHYLSLFGLAPNKILIIFYSLAVIYGFFSLAMFFWDRVLVFSFLVIFMVVIFILFFILMVKHLPRKMTNGRRN